MRRLLRLLRMTSLDLLNSLAYNSASDLCIRSIAKVVPISWIFAFNKDVLFQDVRSVYSQLSVDSFDS